MGDGASRTPSRVSPSSTILPEVHHGEALAHRTHDREVVGDEQICERERLLQRSRSSFSTLACTETSSPEVGSSRMTMRGLQREDAGETDAALLAAADSSCG